ncbi:peptidoglycan DD-metalloendopeptidase family protein [Laceyella putida]|uniref:Peptidoglycan DD-metalloendopeptidase family protein n=1 Tax=Laceyella putida TaxID=110101 RepID=A0ABW2RGH0_9BACL
MSSKRALLASSLAVTTSASWMFGTDKHPVVSAEMLEGADADPEQKQIAEEAIYQYLNPVVAVAEGNLAARVETKPLVYQVKQGDTLFQIGRFFGIDYQVIAQMNQLPDPDRLDMGLKLTIPLTKKWVRLKQGDSIGRLAKEFRTTPDLIRYLNPELYDAELTYIGQLIAVPMPLADLPKPFKLVPKDHKRFSRLATTPALRPPGAFVFHWPVTGQVTSNFGWRNGRQHKGIDIWSPAKQKAEIHASLSGVVIQAGYANGYGNLVVVEHGGGWVTYYAHLSRITVGKGEQVATGQVLGYMGMTGRATGYHLHFEVRKEDKAINPLRVLR